MREGSIFSEVTAKFYQDTKDLKRRAFFCDLKCDIDGFEVGLSH